MKSQKELYQALSEAERIVRENNLMDTLVNATRLVTVIGVMAKRADEPNDLLFKHVAFDVIRTYASLLDETIDDIHSIAESAMGTINLGLMEPEAEEGRYGED